MTFQRTVNQYPAPAVEGAFASANPRASVVAGDSQLIADTNGVIVGRFAWMDATGTLVNNYGTGAPTGFVGRALQATITSILTQQASMQILAGFPVTLFNQGDFWGRTGTAATIGQKVFASLVDGSISTAAAGTTIAASSFKAFIVNGLMTVYGAVTGTIAVGQEVTGAGIPIGTYVSALGTGSGGAGTYTLSAPTLTINTTIAAPVQANASTVNSGGTVTDGTYYAKITAYNANGETVGSNEKSIVAAGGVANQSTITFNWAAVPGATGYKVYTSTSAGTEAHYTDVGNVVTYTFTATPVGTSGTVPTTNTTGGIPIVGDASVETNFIVASTAASGELIKMSTWGA